MHFTKLTTILLIISACIIAITSCNPSPSIKHTEVIAKGHKKTFDYVNDTLTSYVEEYDKDGVLFWTYYLVKGKRDGTAIIYYPNGKIKMISIFKNGLRNGPEYVFYQSGKLNSARDYFSLGDTSYFNNCITFFENGDTNHTQTSYCNIIFAKDTFNSSKDVIFSVFLKPLSGNDSTSMFFNLDSNFNATKSTTYITFRGNQIKVKDVESKKGLNTFRGYLTQYSTVNDSLFVLDLFFQKQYYIR